MPFRKRTIFQANHPETTGFQTRRREPTTHGGIFDMVELLTFPLRPLVMATCPKCLGALTDDHKCPRGLLSRVTDALGTTAVGASAGWILVLLVEERPAGALIVAAAALGAVLATAVRQAIGGQIR